MCKSGTDSELPTVRWRGLRFKSDGMMCDAEAAQTFVQELLKGSFLPCQPCRFKGGVTQVSVGGLGVRGVARHQTPD